MIITNILLSNLSLQILPGEKKYIYIYGHISRALISLELIAGDSCSIQGSIVDRERFELAKNHADVPWENIFIDGVEYNEIETSFNSIEINCPSFLFIENKASSLNPLTINFRGYK